MEALERCGDSENSIPFWGKVAATWTVRRCRRGTPSQYHGGRGMTSRAPHAFRDCGVQKCKLPGAPHGGWERSGAAPPGLASSALCHPTGSRGG